MMVFLRPFAVRCALSVFLLLCASLAFLNAGCGTHAGNARSLATPVVWKLDDPAKVGGHATEVIGSPRPTADGGGKGLWFDGKGDGFFMHVNPVAGWSAFTIEVRFKPDGTGDAEQRFLHIQDEQQSRLLIETRVTKDRQWALDTFLYRSDKHKRTLLDPKRLHPTDRWHWVALVYDGKTMSHYVDGVKEGEAKVAFRPMSDGCTSLGVRQNRICWFKGGIGEVRFTPWAMTAAALQREAAP